jgi:Mlc titration factor MtfA (ptsG expression regulator)
VLATAVATAAAVVIFGLLWELGAPLAAVVAIFIDDAEITGVNATVTDEVRILIASSAVMLVFGRPGWEYSDLPEILVYPAAFDEDYRCAERPEFNVGLHEFAHLLDLEDDRFDGALAEYLGQDPAG